MRIDLKEGDCRFLCTCNGAVVNLIEVLLHNLVNELLYFILCFMAFMYCLKDRSKDGKTYIENSQLLEI